MFRSHWTIIREHVDPSQSYHLSLIFYVTLWCCGSMPVINESLKLYSPWGIQFLHDPNFLKFNKYYDDIYLI